MSRRASHGTRTVHLLVYLLCLRCAGRRLIVQDTQNEKKDIRRAFAFFFVSFSSITAQYMFLEDAMDAFHLNIVNHLHVIFIVLGTSVGLAWKIVSVALVRTSHRGEHIRPCIASDLLHHRHVRLQQVCLEILGVPGPSFCLDLDISKRPGQPSCVADESLHLLSLSRSAVCLTRLVRPTQGSAGVPAGENHSRLHTVSASSLSSSPDQGQAPPNTVCFPRNHEQRRSNCLPWTYDYEKVRF